MSLVSNTPITGRRWICRNESPAPYRALLEDTGRSEVKRRHGLALCIDQVREDGVIVRRLLQRATASRW